MRYATPTRQAAAGVAHTQDSRQNFDRRQFRLMKEKSRCSISFHLLVPGSRWVTSMVKPLLSAKCWSSVFQSEFADLPCASARICFPPVAFNLE